jgi:hypothetical protein
MDSDKAKQNFLLPTKLGHVFAVSCLGHLLEESNPHGWRLWGRAAALGSSGSFLYHFSEQVEVFNSGSGSAAVMFAIGQALQGHMNEQARRICNWEYDFDSLVNPAKQAIAFYEAQIKATKAVMHAWTQVGIKLNVVKDVRKLIAKLIWDSREETLYDVSEGGAQEVQEEQKEQEPQLSARALRAQKRARK